MLQMQRQPLKRSFTKKSIIDILTEEKNGIIQNTQLNPGKAGKA